MEENCSLGFIVCKTGKKIIINYFFGSTGRYEKKNKNFWVCTLCTRPNFDSVHCSESLFMNTVHKVFKKKKNNNK